MQINGGSDMNDDPEKCEAMESRLKKRIFLAALILAIAFMAYGTYLGNVFETYHNGSTL